MPEEAGYGLYILATGKETASQIAHPNTELGNIFRGNRHSKHVEMGRLVMGERAALSVSYRDILLAPPPEPD